MIKIILVILATLMVNAYSARITKGERKEIKNAKYTYSNYMFHGGLAEHKYFRVLAFRRLAATLIVWAAIHNNTIVEQPERMSTALLALLIVSAINYYCIKGAYADYLEDNH